MNDVPLEILPLYQYNCRYTMETLKLPPHLHVNIFIVQQAKAVFWPQNMSKICI